MLLWAYILKATAIPPCSMSAHDNFSTSDHLLLRFHTFVALAAPRLCSRPLSPGRSLYIRTVSKLRQASLEDKPWPMLSRGPEVTCLVCTRVLESSKTSRIFDSPRRDPAPLKVKPRGVVWKHLKNVRLHTPGYCCRWVSPISPCKESFTGK